MRFFAQPDMLLDWAPQERAFIVDSYPGWHETRKFTMQVRSTILAAKDHASKCGLQW